MPKADDVKTKLVRKSLRLPVLVVVLALSIIVLAGVMILVPHGATLRSGNQDYHLLVATTAAAQEKGLGDRASLPNNEGMLFVFSGQATRCFWMKDMHFSLDMVWANSQKRVVALDQNVLPASYPGIFCPAQSAQYVIELNSGQAKIAGISVGSQLKF